MVSKKVTVNGEEIFPNNDPITTLIPLVYFCVDRDTYNKISLGDEIYFEKGKFSIEGVVADKKMDGSFSLPEKDVFEIGVRQYE